MTEQAELSLSFQLENYEKVTFFLQIWLFRKFTRKINIEDAQLDVTKIDFFTELRKKTFSREVNLLLISGQVQTIYQHCRISDQNKL